MKSSSGGSGGRSVFIKGSDSVAKWLVCPRLVRNRGLRNARCLEAAKAGMDIHTVSRVKGRLMVMYRRVGRRVLVAERDATRIVWKKVGFSGRFDRCTPPKCHLARKSISSAPFVLLFRPRHHGQVVNPNLVQKRMRRKPSSQPRRGGVDWCREGSQPEGLLTGGFRADSGGEIAQSPFFAHELPGATGADSCAQRLPHQEGTRGMREVGERRGEL